MPAVRRRRLNMRRLPWLIVALAFAGLLVVGGPGVWFLLPRPEVTIEISGSPGMKLIGTIKADQEQGQVEGPVPNTITAKGRSVSYTIENVGEPGDMTVRVLINGNLSDTITADRDHPIVQGTVENRRVSQNAEQKQGQ